MNKRLPLSLALALALCGSQAHALGLGQIQVKSALNQPLVAEIPVLVSSPGEADALRVRLASADAFARIGLDQPGQQVANLSFEVSNDAYGRTVILVTSPESVSDPFLSFLLEVDWGKGKMLREYTVLLDPPSMVSISGSAPATVAPVIEPEPARTEPLLETPPPMPEPLFEEPAPEPPMAAPPPEPAPAVTAGSLSAQELDSMSVAAPPPPPPPAPIAAPATSAPAHVGDVYGPVDTGDTLWTIAQNTRPDESVTINQMMLALLRANPEAFIDNNINRLRKGAVLRIPAREETTLLAVADAAAQVREQMQAWNDAAATVMQPAAGMDSTPARSRRTAGSSTDSRLELTPPGDGGAATATMSGASADGAGRELRAELARTREEVSALGQENVELKSRVSELEDLQGESRRLLDLKDSELAAVQQQLREANAERERAAAAALVDSETVATATTDDAALAMAVVDTVEDTAEIDAPEEVGEFPDLGDTSDPAGVDEVSEEPATASLTEYEPVPVAAEPAPAEAEVLAPASPVPADVESGAGSGFNPWLVGGGAALLLGLIGLLLARRGKKSGGKAGAGTATVTETLPAVAAYETDEEEGELIEAITQHPDDLELHLDLLRHYQASGDALGFEMGAEAMFAQVRDASDPAWQEALALGRQIAPEHPLFAGASSTDELHAPIEPSSAAEVQGREVAEEDFIPEPAADEAWSSDDSFEFGDEAEPAQVRVDAVVDAVPGALEDEIEFEFEPVAEFDASDDLAEGGIDADVATTKLELARAYLDMGDSEGARGMLEEVLGEGNAAQREEARQLLDGIS